LANYLFQMLSLVANYYLLTIPLVTDPKYPVAEIPLAFCNFIRAFLVSDPNVVISLPNEPGPVVVIGKP